MRYLLDRDVFRRACAAKGLGENDVRKKLDSRGVIGRTPWYDFIAGKTKQHAGVFGAIGDVLDREASTFMVLPRRDIAGSAAVKAYAERLEDLILTGGIPRYYEDASTNDLVPTDIVDYVEHRGDVVLSAIPLTDHERFEAFQLVKHWDLLEEGALKVENGVSRRMGPMRIARVDQQLILHDLAQQQHLENEALVLLESCPAHWVKTQRRYHHRLLAYVALSQSTEEFNVNRDEAVERDWDCRRALLISGCDETALQARHRHTRFALTTIAKYLLADDRLKEEPRYPAWWRKLYSLNKNHLVRIGNALGKPGTPPDFTELRRLARRSNIATRRIVTASFRKAPEHLISNLDGSHRID